MRKGRKESARHAGVECRLYPINPEYWVLSMNDPRKKNPTFGIAVFIVVAVMLVIATLFYNAIREKRDFDEQNTPAPAAASVSTTTGPAGGTGASQ
ncbi:hypothetical protein P3T23_001571 [Paraburkholderia sp. GAS448]